MRNLVLTILKALPQLAHDALDDYLSLFKQIVIEFLSVLFALTGIWLIQELFTFLMGEMLFFDTIKVKYINDAAFLAVLIAFITSVVRKLTIALLREKTKSKSNNQ
jgi:hypothetical protein